MMRLAVFLAIFLAIYIVMHAVVYWGIRPLLSSWSHPVLLTLMGVMIVLPVVVRILDRAGLDAVGRPLAWAGYIWMGFVFLAFSLFVLLGLWHLIRSGASHFVPLASGLPGHGPSAAGVVLGLTLVAGVYGLYEANHVRVETIRIETAKFPPGSDALRIVQVSDLHLGLMAREGAARRVAQAVKDLRPDLLVATGDLVDAQINHIEGLSRHFASLHPPLGKFAVTGNHEIYAGLDQSLAFLQRAGFTLLRNEAGEAGDALAVAGVDDPAAGSPPPEVPLLRELDTGRFIVLLKHRPQVNPASADIFDLQLSGHAHRGQIFPFNFITGLAYPLQDGLYPLTRSSQLYTSRGTGTWGPPLRVFSPPEITLFEVVPPSFSPRGT